MRVWLAVAVGLVLAVPSGSAEPARNTVTMAAVGDVLFARGVGKQIARHGADWPFELTRKIISDADIGFCNLECSLSKQGVPQHRKYQFRADPAFALALRRGGFTVASLANNHTMDFGREAMLDTAEAVEKAGITGVGAGEDREDAVKLRVVEKNGLKVGFLAFTDIWNSGVVRMTDRPTVAGIDTDDLPDQIRSAKKLCDCLVVSFHWGVEYMKRPTERQRMIARLCIDNGADAILGHHPHVLQPTELYKGKPIIYSMGAFVWDAKIFGADNSAIYLIKLSKSSARIVETVPIKVIGCRPTVGMPHNK